VARSSKGGKHKRAPVVQGPSPAWLRLLERSRRQVVPSRVPLPPGMYPVREVMQEEHRAADCPFCQQPEETRRRGWPMPCPVIVRRLADGQVQRCRAVTPLHAWNCTYWDHGDMTPF
jgi:hypothetical protein